MARALPYTQNQGTSVLLISLSFPKLQYLAVIRRAVTNSVTDSTGAWDRV